MKVKIYGERNCGTNYLEKLIENNIEAELIKFKISKISSFLLKSIKYDFVENTLVKLQRKTTLGWKHGCAPAKAIKSYRSDPLVIITITKNPYSFLSSLYLRPYHLKGTKPASLTDFINHSWITRGRDLCDKKKLNSPIELWNQKNISYINLQYEVNAVVVNLSYEELISNPEKCIRELANRSNLKFKNQAFQNVNSSTKNDSLSFENYQDKYLNEEWRNDFKGIDLSSLNHQIDDSIMEYFNYEKINHR